MSAIDSRRFRDVLGHFPTGIVVVTASRNGRPVGMAVNSFTSVSLDPPLVLFCPARSSSTWPDIAAAGRFCVNLLRREQAWVARRFAARDIDRFDGIVWGPSPGGAPLLAGTVGWLDCRIELRMEAGDHIIVLGHVEALDVSEGAAPLLFFRGGHELPQREPGGCT
ncbi:flavin reductase family protein [Sphaerisporangium fuscum]|uniref:flavin reductase family protein n=1 Tax=Sphaerisporangium fuscum TaxID=2835868 RepID=UPI001BDD0369|nr:flavin reductase family protein [Sphaerisporangium fuscum]